MSGHKVKKIVIQNSNFDMQILRSNLLLTCKSQHCIKLICIVICSSALIASDLVVFTGRIESEHTRDVE